MPDVPGARPGGVPLNREGYLDRWSELHGGVAPRGIVGGWLSLAYRTGRPLARLGVPPDVVTLLGLVVAALVLPLAAAGGRWVLLAVAVVVLSALLDGVDGTVAILSGRVTPWGYVLDSLCDRLADACYVGALWLAGADGPLCVLGGGISWLQEYLRARAAGGGMSEAGVITVSERPTRVIVTAMFLIGAGLYPEDAAGWATAGAAAWATLGAVGVGQLAVVVRRRLGRQLP